MDHGVQRLLRASGTLPRGRHEAEWTELPVAAPAQRPHRTACQWQLPCSRLEGSASDFFLAPFFKKKYSIGADVVSLGARVNAYVAWMWHELDTVDLGTKLGADYYGAELWKLKILNFYHDFDIEKYG